MAEQSEQSFEDAIEQAKRELILENELLEINAATLRDHEGAIAVQEAELETIELKIQRLTDEAATAEIEAQIEAIELLIQRLADEKN